MTTMAQARIPDSPSQLADSLANIRLEEPIHDHEDDSSVTNGDSTTTYIIKGSAKIGSNPSSPSSETGSLPPLTINATPSSIAENLKKISNGLDSIREQLFIIQEKRHAGVFTIADDVGSSSFSGSTNTPTKDNKVQKEKNLVLDVEMAKLNALMEGVSNRLATTETNLQDLDQDDKTPSLQRRGSFASLNSLSSLDSFDDAFGVESIGITKKPEILRKQYADLLKAWEEVQKESKTLEDELSGDKYLRVFNSIGDQMEEMMDSLDKALANCHDFVFAFNRDRAQQAMGDDGRIGFSSSASSTEGALESKDQPSWRSNEERLAALQTVKRSFNVKRTSYGPACEQMFSSLERGVKQHSTRNGTILRRFMELKTRWRSLRDRVSRMDKELKRIESRLMEFNADTAQDVESLAVSTPPRRPLSRLNSAAYSPSVVTTGNSKHIAHDRSPSLGYSPSANISTGNLSSSLNPTHSPSSSMIYHRPPSSASLRAEDTKRQSRIPRLMSAGKRIVSAASRRSSVVGEERPSSSLSFVSNSTAMFGASPSSSRIRTNFGGPGSSPPVSFSQQREHEAALRSSMQTPEPTIMARVQRMSLFGGGGVGASSAKRSSRPPPVRYSANRVAAAAENNMNRSPSSNSLSAIATSNAAAVNARNSPQQQNSKPLNIAKRNSSLFNNNGRTTPLSAAALAKVPYAINGLNGEELPAGQYRIISSPPSNSGVSGLNTGDGASSVSNYRAKRSSMIGMGGGGSSFSQSYSGNQSMSASITSGRETPTFSDGGNSSVWEGTIYGARPSSRLTTGFGARNSGIIGGAGSGMTGRSRNRGFDPYKPNPNDAIDIEVARVVNNLGVRIERVDPPLPRGVKEMNPSSSKLVRYQVGTKVIVCKLLQLHRPANAAMKNHLESDAKAKKVLTRVGGGWIDLEQYLLSRLGTM